MRFTIAMCFLLTGLPVTIAQSGAKPSTVEKTVTIDFTQTVNNPDGKPFTELDADKKTLIVTLGEVAETALNTPLDTDRGESAHVAYQRGDLVIRIHKNKSAVLEASDISLIVDRIGRCPTYLAILKREAIPLVDPNYGKSK